MEVNCSGDAGRQRRKGRILCTIGNAEHLIGQPPKGKKKTPLRACVCVHAHTCLVTIQACLGCCWHVLLESFRNWISDKSCSKYSAGNAVCAEGWGIYSHHRTNLCLFFRNKNSRVCHLINDIVYPKENALLLTISCVQTRPWGTTVPQKPMHLSLGPPKVSLV